jgi:ubiquitin C-terminal hydrolase
MYITNNNNTTNLMNTQINHEKYKNKGLSGMANLGNTCFINSCMQIISHTYEFDDILDDENTSSKVKNKYDSALLIEWNNLRKILWENNCVVIPNKFIKTIQKVAEVKGFDIFTGYSQNDVAEFLLFLIDCFHNSLSREIKMNISGKPENETDRLAIKCFDMIKNMYTNEYSEIWKLFYGVHISYISSLENNEIFQENPEPYFMIDLPIPQNNKNPTLIDCFNLYIEGEELKNENAWYNEKTKEKINIKKKILFWSLPNILVIDFKRFNSRNQKNQILIDFPLDNLDLSEYVIGYKKKSYIYELYGICNHSGSVFGGHYTSYVKTANGKWYHFNDTNVTEVSLVNAIISQKAYVLFYRKKQNH